MQEVSKTYQNGQKLTIYDDGVSDVSTLRATLTKTFTAADGETFEQPVVEGTENDLNSLITNLDIQIEKLQAQKAKAAAQKAALRTELDKLPERSAESI